MIARYCVQRPASRFGRFFFSSNPAEKANNPKGTGPMTDKSNMIGKGKPGPGRPKGVPNKMNALLKDSIIEAATKAGGEGGLVGYLTLQAQENPGPFLTLLGKVLPMQIADADGAKIIFPSEIILTAARDSRDD